jgi:hypothetical protein
MSLEKTSSSSSTLDDITVTVFIFSQSLTSRSPPACSSNKHGSILEIIAPAPPSSRHDLLRICVFTDTVVATLQSLHADHDDQPGRRTGFGVFVEIDVVSTTAKICRRMGFSMDAVSSYLILDVIFITIKEDIKVFNLFKI